MVSGYEKKLKIAIDLRIFDWTGLGRVAKGIAKYIPYLIPQYEYVFILNPGQGEHILHNNVEKVYISPSIFDFRAHHVIWSVLKKRPDIKIYHALHFNIPWYLPSGVKLVTNIYDLAYDYSDEEFRTIFHKLYFQVFFNRAIRKSTTIITQSDYTSQDLKRFYKCEKNYTISPGFDAKTWVSEFPKYEEEIFKKHNLGKKYILYVGVNKPRKNLKTLVSAYYQLLKKCPQSDIDLVIVGRVKDKCYDIEKDITKKNLANRIHLLGFVQDNELKLLYRYAFLYVVPSLLESGFSYPALEAASLGVPVLVNKKDMEGFGKDALYYFDARSVDDCAQKLMDLISKSELRKKLSNRGRSWSREFSWDKYAAKLMAVYQKLLL